MGKLKTEDEKKLVGYLGNLPNEEGGYSYNDLRKEPPEGMGVTNNTISKYKKKYKDVKLEDIDVNNVRDSLQELEIPEDSTDLDRSESGEGEESSDKKKEAQTVDNLKTKVKDERKQKNKDKGSSSSDGSFELSDPSKKSHIKFVKQNTKCSTKKQAQQTLLNMREDGVEINTATEEVKK
jgi:hypothetical protein